MDPVQCKRFQEVERQLNRKHETENKINRQKINFASVGKPRHNREKFEVEECLGGRVENQFCIAKLTAKAQSFAFSKTTKPFSASVVDN